MLPFEDDRQSLYDEIVNAPDPNREYESYVLPCEERTMHSYTSEKDYIAATLPERDDTCSQATQNQQVALFDDDGNYIRTINRGEVFKPKEFTVKDSGERASFDSGMVRDVNTGKMRPDLVRDGPMLFRWVILMTRGAVKYAARNWMQAKGKEEYDRFLESADRHFYIWYTWRKYGLNVEDPNIVTTDPLKEDHAAAVYFNINGTEYTADQMEKNGK